MSLCMKEMTPIPDARRPLRNQERKAGGRGPGGASAPAHPGPPGLRGFLPPHRTEPPSCQIPSLSRNPLVASRAPQFTAATIREVSTSLPTCGSPGPPSRCPPSPPQESLQPPRSLSIPVSYSDGRPMPSTSWPRPQNTTQWPNDGGWRGGGGGRAVPPKHPTCAPKLLPSRTPTLGAPPLSLRCQSAESFPSIGCGLFQSRDSPSSPPYLGGEQHSGFCFSKSGRLCTPNRPLGKQP